MIINFAEPINVSVQIGDIAWYIPSIDISQSGVAGNMYSTASVSSALMIGVIEDITTFSITVNTIVNTPTIGSFIMFSKNNEVNKSNLLGYYAEVTMVNKRKDKVELFSVSTEITESSK